VFIFTDGITNLFRNKIFVLLSYCIFLVKKEQTLLEFLEERNFVNQCAIFVVKRIKQLVMFQEMEIMSTVEQVLVYLITFMLYKTNHRIVFSELQRLGVNDIICNLVFNTSSVLLKSLGVNRN